MFATMCAAIFGAVGLHAWIPSVTATVACIESLLASTRHRRRLEGANGALTRLKTLRIWWQSPSRTQQKMPQTRRR